MTKFRELIASVEWGDPTAAFRLARLGAGTDAPPAARLKTSDGQVLDLPEADWRALSDAVARLFGPSDRAEPKAKPVLPNAGQPWTADMDKTLVAIWRAGRTVGQIAAEMGRSRGAISSRLVRLGLVDNREQAEGAAEARPPRDPAGQRIGGPEPRA